MVSGRPCPISYRAVRCSLGACFLQRGADIRGSVAGLLTAYSRLAAHKALAVRLAVIGRCVVPGCWRPGGDGITCYLPRRGDRRTELFRCLSRSADWPPPPLPTGHASGRCAVPPPPPHHHQQTVQQTALSPHQATPRRRLLFIFTRQPGSVAGRTASLASGTAAVKAARRAVQDAACSVTAAWCVGALRREVSRGDHFPPRTLSTVNRMAAEIVPRQGDSANGPRVCNLSSAARQRSGKPAARPGDCQRL